MSSPTDDRKKSIAMRAGVVVLGLIVLACVPVRLVDAEPTDSEWRKPKSPSKSAPNEDDDWRPRKTSVIPAGGQLPKTEELPKPLPELPAPPKQAGPELPPPKAKFPTLPPPVEKLSPRSTLPPPKTALPPPTGKGETNVERSILLAAARNSVKQRDWSSAISRFEEVFRRYGDDADLRGEFAGILVQAGRIREALASYNQAVNLRSDDPKLRIQFGDVAVLAREYPTAITQFTRALELRPNDVEYAIRLARALVFDGDPAKGQAVYDRMLAQFRPDDEDAPITLPNLLVDLRRPAEALAFLKVLRASRPSDAELFAATIRAFSMLGDRQQALETLDRFWAVAPEAQTVRRELAEALFGSEDYDLSVTTYEHLLRGTPNSLVYLAGMARAQIALFQTASARQILEPLKPTLENSRAIHLAMAEYHRTVGEWAEAREQYRWLLDFDAKDDEARIGLGNLYERAREDEKAKAEFSKVPIGTGFGRRARLAIAQVLVNQRRFAEAADLCKQILHMNPDDASALSQLIRVLAKWGKADQAIALGRGYLHNQPRNEAGQTAIRLALGRALIEGAKPQEAARIFDQAIQRVGGQVPEGYYGLHRAFELFGDRPRAEHALAMCLALPFSETRHRILLADLHSGDFADPPAAALLEEVVKIDPANLAAQIRLAEAQGRLARPTGDSSRAVQTATEALAQAPTDAQARLALARNHNVANDFKAAVTEFEQMLATVPDFFVPQRELARTLYSANDFNTGAAAYQRIQSPPADQELHAALAEIAQRDPRVALLLGPCLVAPGPGRVLRVEVSKAIASLADADLSDRVAHAFLDFEARVNEQALAKLEANLKANGWRRYDTIVNARALIEVDPSNTSARFDLGQAQSSLLQTKAAIATYSELLGINPQERESAIALNRAGLELQPQLNLGAEIFGQRGRTGLANIVRERVSGVARLPFGDEDEYCEVGYAHVRYRPSGHDDLLGSILIGRVQSKHHDRLLAFANVNIETYGEDRLSTRPTGEAGLRYDVSDEVRLRGSLFLDNVVENGESLRQDIYRYGARLGADYRPSRRWRQTGTYTVAHYSDDNDYNDLFLTCEYTMLFAPTQLKVVMLADVYGYREQLQPTTPDPSFLVGAKHPYFSPDGFGYTETRLEWTHWLSRDYFAHSNQTWYSVQAGLGFDTNAVRYHTARVMLNHDIRPWLTVTLDAYATLSDAYDSAGISAHVIIRFPGIR